MKKLLLALLFLASPVFAQTQTQYYTVPTIAALKAMTTSRPAVVQVVDSNPGIFNLSSGACSAADDVFQVQPTAGTTVCYTRTTSLDSSGAAGAQAASQARWGLPFTVPPGAVVTVAVPSQKATLQAALDAVAAWAIPYGAAVQINVANGTYPLAAGLNINNPYGARLRIVGNIGTPASVVFEVATNSITAFYVGAGSGVYINGITLNHTNSADRANTIGFLADEGGYIFNDTAVRGNGFFWNLFARRGGIIRADDGIYTLGGDTNALAYQGGHIDCVSCTLTLADDALSTLGSGAVAEGGTLDLTSATLTGNKRAGLHLIDGYVRAGSTSFSSNTGPGIRHEAGLIDITTGTVAGGNGTYGYERSGSGRATAPNLSLLAAGGAGANGTALYRPLIEDFYSSQPGDRVVSASTNEARRYDSKGTGAHFFNTGGGVQFSIFDIPSAVNSIFARGAATGGIVRLGTTGTDTDVDIEVAAQGTGSIRLMSQGANVFEAFGNTTPVNYLATRAASAGGAPQFEVLGAGTNVNLGLVPKGTGAVVTNAAIGVGTTAPTAGYALHIAKNPTGATTTVGARTDGTIQSDVTTAYHAFYSRVATQATTFTLTTLNHFYANPQAFGAGSTVTSQFGFVAESSLTGAATNIGFYGNIASAAGRWNFYAAGTAANAYAGLSRFGGVTTPTEAVDVTGNVRATGTIRANTGFNTNGTAGIASCTAPALGATITITGGLVTAMTGC